MAHTLNSHDSILIYKMLIFATMSLFMLASSYEQEQKTVATNVYQNCIFAKSKYIAYL
jgi:hypothetical protein